MNRICILFEKGFSLFKPIMDIVPYTQAPRSSVIEDFNGDGINDIFIADTGVDFGPRAI